MRLLLAEDELDLAEALTTLLERNQYLVDAVYNGEDAYHYACTGNYDALILDVMMPKMDGIQVLKRLREDGITTPTMMLTAKTERSDRILGFDSGADDYLPKPFAPDELLSRIRAILRRGGSEYRTEKLTFCDLRLDSNSGSLFCGQQSCKLSGKELKVMELFLRYPNTVFSADRIMNRVWGWDTEAEINVVWVNISNLRKKLKQLGSHTVIRVSRGLGYSLEDTDGQ